MKRQTKLITAFIMTLLLILGAPLSAFAATTSTGSLTGSSTITDVVINVILPTNLNFALDPLGLDATGQNQITTQDYFFVNQTLAPVQVALSLSASATGSAVLVSTTSGIKKDDITATTKAIYFGALGATGLTGASITTTTTGITYSSIFGSTTGPAAQYATVTAISPTLVKFSPNTGGTTGTALIDFALQKATESTTTPGTVESLATNNDGVAAFQFFAEMNTYADWKANDLRVSGSYTLTALRDSTYTGFTYVTDSLNQLVPTTTTTTYSSAGFIVNGTTTTTYSSVTRSSSSAVNVVLPFYANGLTVSSLTSSTTSIYTVPTTQYAISVADNTFTIYATDAACWLRVASVGTKYMTIKLSDNSTYTFSIIQQ